MNYRQSGVDIKKSEALVEWIKKQSPAAKGREGIGGFSALFRPSFKGIKNPCFAASTDGVGSKVLIASHFQSYKEVGQDLVAMCVNDIVCAGATPLFFMDYYACGRLKNKAFKDFLKGVLKACKISGCTLIGGETAEMPGCYSSNDFDCSGFALGILDEKKKLGQHRVRHGDRLIGVLSSGFHSNGFSLLRKVFKKDMHKWKKDLLKPTALYAPLAVRLFKVKGLKAMAHITGGGMDNLLRVLPEGWRAELKLWPVPDIFKEVKSRAKITWPDLLKTFNCGVGLVLVVCPTALKKVQKTIQKEGFKFFDLGCVLKPKTHRKAKTSWSFL